LPGRILSRDGEKHKQRIIEKFNSEAEKKEIIILDIPDEYQFMDPELIEDLKTKIDHYLIGKLL